MKSRKLTLLWAAALSVLSLCGSFAAEAPTDFKVSEFTFARPAKWEWVPVASAMRKAQLKVAGEGIKDPAEVVFFNFGPGQGGGVKANVDRWFSQFEGAPDKKKMDVVMVGKAKVTYAEALGTYLSGMPGGPKTPMKDYSLLGAILESPEGNVFIRMTGPSALVKDAAPAFKQMVEGALKK